MLNMDDNKKFDRYIKGLFEEDPKVPTELSWEAMNFDLPKQKNKINYRLYILLVLVMMIGFQLCRKEVVLVNNFPINIPIAQHHLIKDSDRAKSQKAIVTEQTNTKQTNQANITPSREIPKQQFIPEQSNEQVVEEIVGDILPNLIVQEEIIEKDTNNTSLENLSNSEEILVADLIAKIDAQELDYQAELVMNLKPSIDYPEKKDKKFQTEQFFIGAGLNQFNINTTEGNLLKDKVQSILSKSYFIGARLAIDDHCKLATSIHFDAYHTTFEHTRDLDPIFNPQNLQVTNRQEITFHNNYTNVVGWQFSLERRFHLTKRFDLYGGVNVTPTYTVSSIGKTTKEVEIETLSFDESQNSKFALNSGVSLGTIIPINSFMNVEMSYQYRYFLINDIFINNGLTTNQQNNFSILLSYQVGR
jgi:hypothetical protein